MKKYFRDERCPNCGAYHEPTLNTCPSCGHQDPEARDFHAFEHHVHDRFTWQIVYFLIGFVGLQIIGFIVGLIVEINFISTHPEYTQADLIQYLSEPGPNLLTTGLAYVVIFMIFLLIFVLRHRIKEVFGSFAKGKNYLFGVLGAALILGGTLVYNVIINAIFVAAGMGEIGVNNNESAIRAIVFAYPVLSFILFGFVGPFCEEMAYRVGLFGFFTRLGKPLGYAISALIFGLIHFNWNALIDPTLQATLPVEFANLPSYIGSGLALAFLYDRFGLSASYSAHVINNVFSLAITLIQGQGQ